MVTSLQLYKLTSYRTFSLSLIRTSVSVAHLLTSFRLSVEECRFADLQSGRHFVADLSTLCAEDFLCYYHINLTLLVLFSVL